MEIYETFFAKWNLRYLLLYDKIAKNALMAIFGASLYLLIEIVYRNYTFQLSAVMGSITFCAGGILNDRFSWKMDLLLQCGIISSIIIALEAIIGNIDYYWLHQYMWDYSSLPMNYLHGKTCIPFMIIWFFIGFGIVFIHDAITYYWLHEGEQPEYWIFGKRVWQMPIRKCDL